MAAYFQLFPIGYSQPISFQQVDNAICQNLDLPWDADHYVNGWYDYVGFLLAVGRTHAEITDIIHENGKKHGCTDWNYNMLRINHFIMENYTVKAWYSR